MRKSMRLEGRLFAKAVFDRQMVDFPLVESLYKRIIGVKPPLKDLFLFDVRPFLLTSFPHARRVRSSLWQPKLIQNPEHLPKPRRWFFYIIG